VPIAARIALFYGAFFLVVGIQLPFWPAWLGAHGMSAEQIGIILGFPVWVRILTNPLIARAVDATGRRRRMAVALTAMTLACTAVFLVVDGFWAFLIASTVASVFFSAIMPLAENIASMTALRHGLDYGRMRLWGSVTFIVAASGCGALLVGRDEDLILWLSLAALGLSVIAALALPEPEMPPRRVSNAGIKWLLRDRGFLAIVAVGALTQGSHAAFYGFGTIHWRALGIGDDVIGWLWAAGVIAEVGLFVVSGAMIRRIGPFGMLALSAAAGTLRWTVTAWATEAWVLFLMQPLHAFTFAAGHTALIWLIARSVPAEASATAQALFTSLALGGSIGLATLGAGWLYDRAGGDVFLAMTAMSLAGGAMIVPLMRAVRGRLAG